MDQHQSESGQAGIKAHTGAHSTTSIKPQVHTYCVTKHTTPLPPTAHHSPRPMSDSIILVLGPLRNSSSLHVVEGLGICTAVHSPKKVGSVSGDPGGGATSVHTTYSIYMLYKSTVDGSDEDLVLQLY